MKQRLPQYLSLIFLFIVSLQALAQTYRGLPDSEPVALTPQQLYSLSTLPPLTVPEKYKGAGAPALPWWIDNSTQPYFRSITKQTGFECGQSAGVSFDFTYEVDRLRNVPADTTTTTYPSHFTWNFLNNGEHYGGASCFDSWEILRACGNMNVADYGGGLATGGELRWISGYDEYYNGMFNRINFMRSIRVDSPEGLRTLKYWLTDHLEGSPVGGVAILYGKYFYFPGTYLPAGTPEGGKFVEARWGPGASHTFSVVGYNDSIRYDYNGDGKYTNDLDINNDGVIDMHDWEIGGLKLASGYEGTGWANQGFVYTMYKCLADNMGYGGIWNHSVYVISTRETCVPKLTAKIVLKHTSRNKLKVTMGISTNLQATVPSFVLEFPIFKFQGGDHYMQGDSTEEAKSIEFGLDLAPLVNQLDNGQPAQFFLQVEEKDPQGTAEGEITSYSLIDYTSGTPVTTSCQETHVPVANNTVTRLTITSSVNIQRPEITTASLPEAGLYQSCNYQLAASGGSAPYLWDASLEYPESVSVEPFPVSGGEKLLLTDNNTGYSVVTLPFDFPFYQRSVNKIYVYSDGYILFDDQAFYWPYLIDKMLLFKSTSIISPFMIDMNLYPPQSDGIWYQADPGSVTIRWKASINNMPGSSELNFAVKLFSDGKIEIFYGTMNFPGYMSWIGGISSGDNRNYQFSPLNNASVIPANTLDRMNSCGFPAGMKVTEDGLFTGIPVTPCQDCPVTFRVTDNDNISSKKTLLFSTNGLLVNYRVHAGTDTIIDYGETVSVDLFLLNTGGQAIHNTSLKLRTLDPFITLLDSTELAGDLGTGETRILTGAFTYKISPVVPDQYVLPVSLIVSSDEDTFRRDINLAAHSPKIIIDELILADGDNGKLDPGETTAMIVTFKNTGGAGSVNTNVLLSSVDPYLVINSQAGSLGDMRPDSVKSAVFNVKAGAGAPFEHLYSMKSSISAGNGFSADDTSYLFSGDIIEDFETGNFDKFDWVPGERSLFYVDSLEHYEGSFCSRSGFVYAGQLSALTLNVNVLRNGEISFYRKVSCEHDPGGSCTFDYLAFYIDDKEMGRWDGWIDWTLQSYKVEQGYHTFRWLYQKDFSNDWGSDCAWIDFITFPLITRATPLINAEPSLFNREIEAGKTLNDTLFISNSGGGILAFTTVVIDTSEAPVVVPVTDNIGSSYISSLPEGFVPGQAFSWNFMLHNQAGDSENVSQVKMDLTEGADISEVTGFSGGSLGDLIYQEQLSDSATITWWGVTPEGTGVIKPGENAVSVVSGYTDKYLVDDIFMVYTVSGDSTGGAPHKLSGHLRMNNQGIPNTWLTLGKSQGNLSRWKTDTLLLNFDAHGLSPGYYYCRIIIKDGANNNLAVPVTVHVIDSGNNVIPNINGKLLVTGYPNPFSQVVHLEYETKTAGLVQAWVFDISGKRIKTLVSEIQAAGRHTLTWNGENDSGEKTSPGIYYCTMRTTDQTGNLKLILIR
jgi:hypothetical protein